MATVLILNYHRITQENEFIDARYRSFTLSEKELENHFQLLRNLNIPVIQLSELSNVTFSGLCVALTFDDGHRSDIEIVLPLLKKFQFSATFFPVVHHINKEGYVNWEELHLLIKEGHTIGSHGLTHQRLSALTSDEARQEMFTSKELLEEQLGISVRLFSFPYGDYTKTISDMILETGYEQSVSTEFGFNSTPNKLIVLKRWNVKRSTSTRKLKRVLEGNILVHVKYRLKARLSNVFRSIQRNLTHL
ncbi:MAG: polysaccharide deacetylase family protein [Flavobacteriia bacterium]|nr:polysaccharide deacetylase family protein [Flavobacteriia bacterium]